MAEALIACGVPFVYSTGNTDRKFRDVHHERPVLKKPFNMKNWSRYLRAYSHADRETRLVVNRPVLRNALVAQ